MRPAATSYLDESWSYRSAAEQLNTLMAGPMDAK
jgi:hypothetical protein